MNELSLARDIALICAIAFLGGGVAKKLKLPLVTGYIFAGIVFTLLFGGFLKDQANINAVGNIGIALLLFSLGLEFSSNHLSKFKGLALKGVIPQIILTIVITLIIGPLIKLSFYEALFFGCVISLSSSAIIIKILSDRGELDTQSGEISIHWSLIQDLSILPFTLVLPVLAKLGGVAILPSILELAKSIGKTALIIYLLLILGKKIIPRIIDNLGSLNSRELLLIAAIFLSILSAYISLLLGLSFAVGAFIAGILLSTTSKNHAIFAEIRPIRDLFVMIFFVLLGMFVNINFILNNLLTIFWLSLIVVVCKYLIVLFLLRMLDYHFKISHKTALYLAQIGEFAFVLAIFGSSSHIISSYLYSLIISVSLITLCLSPFLISLHDKSYQAIKAICQKLFPKIYHKLFEIDPGRANFNKEGLPLRDHVVICGYGRVGKHIGDLLEAYNIPFLVVEFNQKIVNNLKQKNIPVVYGDPAEYGVLDYAQVDKAKVIVIAVPDKFSQEQIIINSLNLKRDILIICRSHRDEDKNLLLSKGAHFIIQPEFEASLSISHKVLEAFNISKDNITGSLKSLREFHEK